MQTPVMQKHYYEFPIVFHAVGVDVWGNHRNSALFSCWTYLSEKKPICDDWYWRYFKEESGKTGYGVVGRL